MAQLEATAALEEMLLVQRAFIDDALSSDQEDTSLENILMEFHSTLLNHNNQESSFWQLQIVKLIRCILIHHMGSCIDTAVNATISEGVQDPAYVASCVKAHVETRQEFAEAIAQLKHTIEDALDALKKALQYDGENTVESAPFMATFWKTLHQKVARRQKHDKSADDQKDESVGLLSDNDSLERLSFENDINDMSRSGMSFLLMDEFPAILQRMQSTDPGERETGLNEFMQLPILEIVHSGPLFLPACSSIVAFFLETKRAHQFVDELMNQLEDASQFLELYNAVLDFIGKHLESGKLRFNQYDRYQSTGIRCTAMLDCIRVFHTLLCKVMHHWIYLSPEALAQLLHSTFGLLAMHSTKDLKVDTNPRNLLAMLFLVEGDPVRWLQLWLLNAPNLRQVFAALSDSGLIANLLHNVSRVQPLAYIGSFDPSIDRINMRSLQCNLALVSYICEYHQGRALLHQWHDRRALACQTTWNRPSLEPIAIDNDTIYRRAQMPVSAEDLLDDAKDDCKKPKERVVDAIIMLIATIIVTGPTCLRKDVDILWNERWATNMSKSAAIYLHQADCSDLLPALAKLIDACWVDKPSSSAACAVEDARNAWVLFKELKSAIKVAHLVVDCLSKRTRREQSVKKLHTAGQLLLQMILSSKKVYADRQSLCPSTTKLAFKLCTRYLQSQHYKALTNTNKGPQDCKPTNLLDLIMDVTLCPEAIHVARETGVVKELCSICTSFAEQKHGHEYSRLCSRIVRALWHLGRAVNELEPAIVDTFLHTQSHKLSALSCRELFGCLSNQDSARTFFHLADVQSALCQSITELQATVDFAIALNSPDDECPAHVMAPLRRLQWLRCCLSSPFACSSLLSMKTSPLVDIMQNTLTIHRAGGCMHSSCAEDTCCVVFQLLLSLVSSIPSMLECSSLLSPFGLLTWDDERIRHRHELYRVPEEVSSCSFLEKQLCYELNVIGGPKEKLPQRELFAFDLYVNESNALHPDFVAKERNQTLFKSAMILQTKILQTIQDARCMDFTLISQASWELIDILDNQVDTAPARGFRKSTFTKVFAQLTFHLVMSKRSRFESLVKTDARKVAVNRATGSFQTVDPLVSMDAQRIWMSRLYQNYAMGLSLESSSLLFDSIVDTFGKIAIDCFPVTILMILYPVYEKADILSFLSHLLTSSSTGFLWPTSAQGSFSTATAIIIAEKVEKILDGDFPQIRHALDQCQCSVVTLVMRWHGQHFWNYLDWENIVIYTYLLFLYGVEFQIYITVAILKHLEQTMRELTAKHSLQSLAPFLTLLREPIRDFRFSSWKVFLLRLRYKYHEKLDALLSPPS